MNKLGLEALRATYTALDINPGSFDMTFWCGRNACGTVLCIGGHMLVYAGYKPAATNEEYGYFTGPDGHTEYGKSLMCKTFDIKNDDAMPWLFFSTSWPRALRAHDSFSLSVGVPAAKKAIRLWLAIEELDHPLREASLNNTTIVELTMAEIDDIIARGEARERARREVDQLWTVGPWTKTSEAANR